MPYIPQADKARVNIHGARTPGELNYAISELLIAYVKAKGLSYSAINDALGAAEGAKLEFYRRMAAPYETIKAAENGDIYRE